MQCWTGQHGEGQYYRIPFGEGGEAAVVGELVVHQSDGIGAGRAEHNMALCVFVEPGDDKGLDRCDALDEALGDGAYLFGGESAVEGVGGLVKARVRERQ